MLDNLLPFNAGGIPSGGLPGQVLAIGPSGQLEWTTVAGTGDVIGPVSAASGNLPSFADSTGKTLADSGKSIHDLGAVISFRSYFDGQNEIIGRRVEHQVLKNTQFSRFEVRLNSTRLAGVINFSLKINEIEFATLQINGTESLTTHVDTLISLSPGEFLNIDVVSSLFSPKTTFFDIYLYFV